MTYVGNYTVELGIAFGVLLVLVIVALVFDYRITSKLYYVTKIQKMAIDDSTKKIENLESELGRESNVSEFLGNIIKELAHTSNGFSIAWKLQAFRMIEPIMAAHGYQDDNMYKWIKELMGREPSKDKEELLNRLKVIVNGYYTMDMDSGANFYEIIRQMVIYNEQSGRVSEEERAAAMTKLQETIQRLNFKMPIVPEVRPVPEPAPGTNIQKTKEAMDDVINALHAERDSLGLEIPADKPRVTVVEKPAAAVV